MGSEIFAYEQIGERVGIIRVPLPMAVPALSNCYVLHGDDGLHLIDTGWPTPDNTRELLAALGRLQGPVRSVAITHMHLDHSGLAEVIREATGASIAIGRVEHDDLRALETEPLPLPPFSEWGVPRDAAESISGAHVGHAYSTTLVADRTLEDADDLGIPGMDVRVLSSRGHTAGHLAFLAGTDLFTGDSLLPDQHPGIGLGAPDAGALNAYMSTLTRFSELPAGIRALPGHGAPIESIAQRAGETMAHQHGRTAEVRAIVDATPASTVWEVASQVTWTDGWRALTPMQRGQALAQTDMRMRAIREERLAI